MLPLELQGYAVTHVPHAHSLEEIHEVRQGYLGHSAPIVI